MVAGIAGKLVTNVIVSFTSGWLSEIFQNHLNYAIIFSSCKFQLMLIQNDKGSARILLGGMTICTQPRQLNIYEN